MRGEERGRERQEGRKEGKERADCGSQTERDGLPPSGSSRQETPKFRGQKTMPIPPTISYLEIWKGLYSTKPPALPQDKVKQDTNTIVEGRSTMINFPLALARHS